MRPKKWCIYAVFLHLSAHAGQMNVNGPFDLNGNGLDEVLLFTENQLRFVEIQSNGSHAVLWEATPENYAIKDAIIYDLASDGIAELIILADFLPGERSDGNKWLHLYTWTDSIFVPQTISIDNGEVLHPNNCDVDQQSGILSIAVGSPFRAAVLLQAVKQEKNLMANIVNIELPDILHNGFGQVFSSFMNLAGEQHLAVFSPENEILKVVLFRADEVPVVVVENLLPLNGARNLIGSAIQKTDLDDDQREELQLPFANGKVLTLAFVDSVLVLTESKFSGQNIFVLPDNASEESINSVISSRAESGLYDLFDPKKPDSLIVIVPDDTLRLGDTLNYRAAMDTATGFYSFHWLSQPADSAYFDPTTGNITWIPRREDLGEHEFRFYAEKRLKEQLISDVDDLGDRHRILPVLEEAEQTYVVIVIDTVKPPVIYIPPPYKPYIVSVYTPSKTEGNERFIFDGVPSFDVNINELDIPNNPSTFHIISANLGSIKKDKRVDFSYSLNTDSIAKITLTIDHDLAENVIHASVEPPVDTDTLFLNPTDWRSELHHYPTYRFNGFPESLRLGETENGISLFDRDNERKPKKYAHISISTPLADNRHRLSINMTEIELWTIKVNITIDSTGNKKASTTIIFSGEFDPQNITAEMYTAENMAKRAMELQYKILEFMGVDSTAVAETPVVEEKKTFFQRLFSRKTEVATPAAAPEVEAPVTESVPTDTVTTEVPPVTEPKN